MCLRYLYRSTNLLPSKSPVLSYGHTWAASHPSRSSFEPRHPSDLSSHKDHLQKLVAETAPKRPRPRCLGAANRSRNMSLILNANDYSMLYCVVRSDFEICPMCPFHAARSEIELYWLCLRARLPCVGGSPAEASTARQEYLYLCSVTTGYDMNRQVNVSCLLPTHSHPTPTVPYHLECTYI